MASLGILKQLTSLTAEATAREMPPYETKRKSVQRLKTFEDAMNAIQQANETVISKRLQHDEFNKDVEKFRQQIDEDIERAQEV